MKFLLSLPLLVFCLTSVGIVSAMDHNSHMSAQVSEMNHEYMQAMDAMHEPMMKGVMDPDPDTAFVRGMLWHHRGAVDMAKIQLKYGKDPELNKMAEDIIKAQQAEISFMEKWLEKRGKKE